jgi:hypothetical protein
MEDKRVIGYNKKHFRYKNKLFKEFLFKSGFCSVNLSKQNKLPKENRFSFEYDFASKFEKK